MILPSMVVGCSIPNAARVPPKLLNCLVPIGRSVTGVEQ